LRPRCDVNLSRKNPSRKSHGLEEEGKERKKGKGTTIRRKLPRLQQPEANRWFCEAGLPINLAAAERRTGKKKKGRKKKKRIEREKKKNIVATRTR